MEKRHVIQTQNQIKTLLVKDEVLKERTEINKNLYSFYRNVFSLPKVNDKLMCSLQKGYDRRESKTWIE